ncbi:MAG: heme-binding protein, partial [Burkholderiales bacterium]|nr:heme-binding protein [Burkholderiales bacterium]
MTSRMRLSALLLPVLFAACGGGGGGGTSNAPPAPNLLTVADVEKIVAQAIAEAQAQGAPATIAVVDRVGNVLAVYQMTGAPAMSTITSGTGASGGLENVKVPSSLAAISMAVTGAYLSSSGNGFTSRTASQIVQDHFNPKENQQPGGPLFGVQFSQLFCSDLVTTLQGGRFGPKASPLGLSAEPGGLPVYKNGVVVGGVGVMATGVYSLDLDIYDNDSNVNELIAVAGSSGFATPAGVRADRITVDGRSLRFVDSEAIKSNPAAAPAFGTLPPSAGSLQSTPFGGSPIAAGTAFGTPESGYRPDTTPAFAGTNAYVLVNGANANRFPPTGSALITEAEVTQILKSAIEVANRARAQIRQPGGSAAQVTISVVDTQGKVLGLIRTPDAPVFGTDVSLQKARTAAFFSSVTAASVLSGLPPAGYPSGPVSIAAFVPATRAFLSDPNAFANGVAYSNRGLGNLARPYFPDGIAGANAGPLSVAPP